MKRTQKYLKALETLTFPHSSQDILYSELNRLGFYWDSKKLLWIRNDTLADKPSDLIKVRVWAAASQIIQVSELAIEQMGAIGFKLLEKSEPYPCRPPKQLESRIYLLFQYEEDT